MTLKPINPKCPICQDDEILIEQGVNEVRMVYNKKLDFWKCPICRYELHKDIYGQEIEGACVNMKQAAVLLAMVSPLCWPPGVPMQVPPGGSKKAGRKRDTEKLKGLRRYVMDKT
jgi:transposase-like protein